MALVRCRECGQPVGSSAAKCPHCGTPQHPGRGALIFLGTALVLLLCWGLFYGLYWGTREHRVSQDLERANEQFGR
jgi:hypothetical protein